MRRIIIDIGHVIVQTEAERVDHGRRTIPVETPSMIGRL